jgi:hypothetical protein
MSNVREDQAGSKREPFVINISEPFEFEGTASTQYITSNDLLQHVSELFHGVFADFEGCQLEVANGGKPCIALLFNHGEYDADATVATRRGDQDTSKNDVIRSIRNRDFRMANGDRFFLTEDGKDVVKSLLTSQMFNNGNPNWKAIVTEYTEDNRNLYQYTPSVQYTKVSFIDIDRMCGLLYGATDGDDEVVYQANVAGAINAYPGANVFNQNYMIIVNRVSAKYLKAVYEKIGLGSFSRIVR